MYDKPLPVIDPESAPYWTALRDGRLLLRHCRDCGRHHHYPRELCPHCGSDSLDWEAARGTGTIYSYTIARRPAGPAFKPDTPYVVAIIELDEGARLMSNLVTSDVEAVRIGQRVDLYTDAVTPEVTLPRFRIQGAGRHDAT
ncbi:Zn-ribbon domain-containing OB-fold protein [Algiphilus sp. W345]|uniref:Zn-ribbon domain-containing OB-fold protein n=1 Tax=Banduia mediterranea TaxID=3075609 RepID=A0ABU2WE46_9GAMM|nr:Zn-ribbon domain-containing OB-fold protein [Algiphilus sp. W345]MDT0496145.1 Zn-ribbon domain-containing OB-fold protein [Algiphilus sp. W345]